MSTRKILGLVLAAVTVIAVAGCGSSKSSSDSTTTTSMSGMDMSGTTGTTAATASASAVTIQNFAFSPATLTVKVGTTVKWTNMDSTTHTVTSGGNRTADGKFDHSMPQGETFEYTFTTAGEYDYFCKPHANMNAKIIVQ